MVVRVVIHSLLRVPVSWFGGWSGDTVRGCGRAHKHTSGQMPSVLDGTRLTSYKL